MGNINYLQIECEYLAKINRNGDNSETFACFCCNPSEGLRGKESPDCSVNCIGYSYTGTTSQEKLLRIITPVIMTKV